MAHGDVRAGGVAHGHHHGERAKAPFIGAVDLPIGGFLCAGAAETRAPIDADALRRSARVEAACGERLGSGAERELSRTIDARGLVLLEYGHRIPFDRGCHLNARALRDLAWQPPDAGTCIAKRTLEILERVTDRRDDAGSGYCDAPLRHR